MTDLEKLAADYNKSLQDATNEIMEFFPYDYGSMKCIIKGIILEHYFKLFKEHSKLLAENSESKERIKDLTNEYWI